MDDLDKANGFMDKLRGGMSTREGVRESAKIMALFMEEFTAAGFTRAEVVQMLTAIIMEAMRAQHKPADVGPEGSSNFIGDA